MSPSPQTRQPLPSSLTVADRLRDLRQARNLSQTEFGRTIGISGRTVRALESGRYTPSVTLACRVARALEQSVETVFQP